MKLTVVETLPNRRIKRFDRVFLFSRRCIFKTLFQSKTCLFCGRKFTLAMFWPSVRSEKIERPKVTNVGMNLFLFFLKTIYIGLARKCLVVAYKSETKQPVYKAALFRHCRCISSAF